MTGDERVQEVAAILAAAILRVPARSLTGLPSVYGNYEYLSTSVLNIGIKLYEVPQKALLRRVFI
jgi:hypothetical protein